MNAHKNQIHYQKYLTTLVLTALVMLLSPATFADNILSPTLQVYKSPSCGCCGKWVEHLNSEGLSTEVHNSDRLAEIKAELGITPSLQSCHTAVTDSGYVFEGHIPARLIKQFLAKPPQNAIGLTVPNMPMGSPGMEMGEHFQAYQVLQINKDGSQEVYAKINHKDQQ
ncbi:Uncharacterised protein [Zhongshania aliphaticivorans]|uniref:Metal-binding protein n=1 Tax=Zhongshania aliphaticivorans TaxID=1470434 RepID=A0A5S9MSX4_9GAMM|nr:DUF411 domain-containing protein [Zhongshania aliphaticivorans]CAA0080133.1 Uncharacterised protein [Zhongshania aliphaticivorans]CAA0085864.1 Uncharacterised protein [Zhongshania aliphaticivorans]